MPSEFVRVGFCFNVWSEADAMPLGYLRPSSSVQLSGQLVMPLGANKMIAAFQVKTLSVFVFQIF